MPTIQVCYNLRSRKGFRGLYGYQYRRGNERRVVVNLDFHGKERRRMHRGSDHMVDELIQTLDHEISHAFSPWENEKAGSAKMRIEESVVKWFERAGGWARRLIICGAGS